MLPSFAMSLLVSLFILKKFKFQKKKLLSDQASQNSTEAIQNLNESHVNEIMSYALRKILQGVPEGSTPAIHFRIFYPVTSSTPSISNLLFNSLKSFKSSTTLAKIAFSIVPVCHLQNSATFISISGIRHD